MAVLGDCFDGGGHCIGLSVAVGAARLCCRCANAAGPGAAGRYQILI